MDRGPVLLLTEVCARIMFRFSCCKRTTGRRSVSLVGRNRAQSLITQVCLRKFQNTDAYALVVKALTGTRFTQKYAMRGLDHDHEYASVFH